MEPKCDTKTIMCRIWNPTKFEKPILCRIWSRKVNTNNNVQNIVPKSQKRTNVENMNLITVKSLNLCRIWI